MFKNYVLSIMSGKTILLTAQEAAKCAIAVSKGQGSIVVQGNLYPVHQVKSIERLDKETEKDLCDVNGIDPQNIPLMENFIKDQKLLN